MVVQGGPLEMLTNTSSWPAWHPVGRAASHSSPGSAATLVPVAAADDDDATSAFPTNSTTNK